MKKTVLAAAVAALAAAYPAAAGASAFKGVVVSHEATRHVLVVTSSTGHARTVHTTAALRVGTVVRVSARRLPDGTYTASRVAAVGHATRARIHGVILRRAAGLTFLSAGRSVLVLFSAGRHAAAVGDAGPAPGTVANVSVSVTPQGGLNTTSITPTGQSASIVIQATVASIVPATATTPGSLTLTINGQPLVLPLPAGTVLPATVVQGSAVTLTVNFGANGPSAQPCNKKECDDDDDDQGDDENDDD